jgi:hypothetical protein
MKKTVLLACLATLFAADAHARNWRNVRRIAQVAACAASMVDARTTLRHGLRETNPALGQGASVVGIKIGLCIVPIVLAELPRNRNRHDGIMAAGAAATAAAYSAIAARNTKQ